MAGTTTNRSYPYPTSGDAANIAANIQSLATSIDTDVNTNLAPKASPVFTGIARFVNVNLGYTTTITSGTTVTLTATSTNQQYFTGTTAQTVALPVTSTLTVGVRYRIVNNSTQNITVNSSGGNLVTTVVAGASTTVTCIGTTLTTAADWDTDAPNFSGTVSIPSIDWGYTTTATAGGTTTLTVASTFIQMFTGTLTQTVVLPVTSTLTTGHSYEIHNNGTGALTVNSSGGNLVITIPAGQSYALTCIGTTLTTAADWDADWNGATTITGTGSVVLSASPTFTGTPLSTTAAVDTNTTQIATTAFVVAQASATAPIIDGTATVGTSLRYARQDHIHPTDTSRAALASPTFTGQVTVPAGTTSAAPVIFQSSALLTTAAGGRMEYDNTAFYLTPSQTAVGGRAVVNHSMIYSLTGTRNLSDVNTAQSVFGVGLTVAAATTYEIDMLFSVSTAGATSNSLGIGFGGTATLTSIAYQVEASQNATSAATLTSGSQAFIATAANTAVTTAVATATFRNIWVKGLVRVNASGTFIPQLTFSAATGAVPVVAANSYIKMTPIGTNTVTTIGAWA